jgi:DNA-binding transcriptional regulator YiaG
MGIAAALIRAWESGFEKPNEAANERFSKKSLDAV